MNGLPSSMLGTEKEKVETDILTAHNKLKNR